MQHGSNVIFVISSCFSCTPRWNKREREIWKKRKFLVQFSKGERVSVTSLFLKERVSNFCFLASGSSSLSFLSWPRSSTGDSVSVTVLFLDSNINVFFLHHFLFFWILVLPVPQLKGVVLLFVFCLLPVWCRSVFLLLVLTQIRHGGKRLSHRPKNSFF